MTKFQIAVLSILVLVACVVIMATGIALYTLLPSTPGVPTSTPSPTDTPGPTPTPIIHEWRGTGDDVLFFDAPLKGSGFMSASFSGDGNFIVTLYRADGEYIDLLVNEIGKYNGQTSFVIKTSSQYYLQVEASGRDFQPNWHIKIAPPQ